MKIQVRYFAALREALGAAEELDVPAGSTLGSLRDTLAARSARHAEVLSARTGSTLRARPAFVR